MAVIDNSHNVWMNLQNGDELAKFDPSSKQWTLYSWPNRGTSSRGLHILDRGGVVQASITYFDSSAAARMVMRTKESIEALKVGLPGVESSE
jgi:streptogramin lyase